MAQDKHFTLLFILFTLSFSLHSEETKCNSYHKLVETSGFPLVEQRGLGKKAFDSAVESASTALKQYAKENRYKSIVEKLHLTVPDKDLVGMAVIIMDAVEPHDGNPGRVKTKKGYIERVAHHFVTDSNPATNRIPRLDAFVVVDENGVRTLLDSSSRNDLVFVNPEQRIHIPDKKDIPMETLLKEKGWTLIEPSTRENLGKNGEALIGTEIIGYQTTLHSWGEEKSEVRGIVCGISDFNKWSGWMGKSTSSASTGKPPFIAVDMITPGGTRFEHPLSAPGKYYFRPLNP